MKGIREAAMSPDKEPAITWPKTSSWDTSRYDGNYAANDYKPSYDTGYKKPVKGQITITMSIENNEIGNETDEDNPAYDPVLAAKIAEALAYKRLEELAGNDYAKRYTISFEADDYFNSYEITIILTPII